MIDLQTLITAIKENNLDVFQNISKEDIQPHLDTLFDTKMVFFDTNYTLLPLAAWLERKEIAKELIRLGANVNKADNEGQTPLNLAAYKGYTEIVELLLERNPDVNKANYGDQTPLYWAARWGFTEIVKLLLQHNADVNKAANDRETPLYCAARFNCTEIVQELVKAHISQNKIDTLLTLSERFSIISRAMEKYHDKLKIAKLYHRMKQLRNAPELAQTKADDMLIRIGKQPYTMQVEILSRTVDSAISDNFHELLFKHTNKHTTQTDDNETTQTVNANNKRKRDGDDDPNPASEKRTKQEASKPMI